MLLQGNPSPWATATEATSALQPGLKLESRFLLGAPEKPPHCNEEAVCCNTDPVEKKRKSREELSRKPIFLATALSERALRSRSLLGVSLCMAVCFSRRLLSSTENVLAGDAHFC